MTHRRARVYRETSESTVDVAMISMGRGSPPFLLGLDFTTIC